MFYSRQIQDFHQSAIGNEGALCFDSPVSNILDFPFRLETDDKIFMANAGCLFKKTIHEGERQ